LQETPQEKTRAQGQPAQEAESTITITLGALSQRYPEKINSVATRPGYAALVHDLYGGKNPLTLFTNPRRLNFAGDLKWSHVGNNPEDVEYLLKASDASFVVEVGCYVGTSTKQWAKHLPNGTILAIDAWLGDLASWIDRIDLHSRPREDDVLADGRSSLYDQFMLNMQLNHMNNVVPFSITSTNGARWLATMNYVPDLIYLDTSHEQGETLVELELYWNILRSGGILCGDDYPNWKAVVHDVDAFTTLHGVNLEFAPSKTTWFVRKP